MNPIAPEYLTMFQPWLRHKHLDSQKQVHYDTEKWRAKFSDHRLDDVLRTHPDAITRSGIVEVAKVAYESGLDQDQVMRLFWATMLWGWGTAGNGPTRVSWVLQTNDVASVLRTAFQLITQGQIAEAYEWLCPAGNTRIKEFNESFFSKFLYFAALGRGLARYPLIRDSKINNALQLLLDSATPQQYTVTGYLAYVELMHNWADQLQCRADSIEYLLFIIPLAFWQE